MAKGTKTSLLLQAGFSNLVLAGAGFGIVGIILAMGFLLKQRRKPVIQEEIEEEFEVIPEKKKGPTIFFTCTN